MNRMILAPDPTFTGNCAGIEFCDGVGLCDNDFMGGWLCAKGFTIVPGECAASGQAAAAKKAAVPDDLDGMRLDELVGLARSLDISLAGIPQGNREQLTKAIQKAVTDDG